MISGEVLIKTIHLFPVLDQLLIELLRSLTPEEWDKPTLAKLWTVKDLAAHLLHGNVRTISSNYQVAGTVAPVINSYQDLVNYINEDNATWVRAMKTVSPELLIHLLETTGGQFSAHLAALDPFAPAKYSVAWAGEEKSANWFHIAREYTEKWHHQQQIREAVNKQGIMHRELFYPFIDTLMRGLPHTYRNISADEGTLIKISISGAAGGYWYLHKNPQSWGLVPAIDKTPDSIININPDIAWKLFTNGITPILALQNSILEGNIKLGEKVFDMVAVIA
jgi:uncharacterized protein (TIGR03083 family)